MNYLNSSINFTLLEEDLQQALCEEKLYKLQNDAKFRAVENNVPTYEHFRQLVNGAHLQPLNKKDFKKNSNLSWNHSITRNNYIQSDYVNNLDDNLKLCKIEDVKSKVIPKTNEEFCQIWNMLETLEEKLNYLYEIRNILETNIFAGEISSTLLSDFLTVFKSLLTKDNVHKIIELLSIVRKCNRFYLNLNFLTKEENERCVSLFKELLKLVNEKNKNTVLSLSESYRITN